MAKTSSQMEDVSTCLSQQQTPSKTAKTLSTTNSTNKTQKASSTETISVAKQTDPDGTISLTEYDGLQREKAKYFKADSESSKQIQSTTSYEFIKNYSVDVYTGLDNSSSKSSSALKTTNTTYITADKQVVSEVLTSFKQKTIYEKTNGKIKKTKGK